jgi:hypothetical protein
LYGTSGLDKFVIQIRVSENCCESPDAFLAVMAHELSHVLLASLWHPNKNSELHTDLVPLLLGFREIARLGRKIVRTATEGNIIRTHTTTYGYPPVATSNSSTCGQVKLLHSDGEEAGAVVVYCCR